jgi:hemoglobin
VTPPDPGTRLRRLRPVVPPELDEALIRRVVYRFYAVAREDEVIGPVFRRVISDERWQAHLEHIVTFWSSMLLGTGTYGGRPMPKHMAIPELDDRHFQRWLALFRQTAQELCPPEIAAPFIERSETIGNSFRLNIKVRRGEDVLFLKPLTREHLAEE